MTLQATLMAGAAVVACAGASDGGHVVTTQGIGPLPSAPPWTASSLTPWVFDQRLALLGVRLDGPRPVAWLRVVGETAGRRRPELQLLDDTGARAVPIRLALTSVEWRRDDVLEVPIGPVRGRVRLAVSDEGRRWPAVPRTPDGLVDVGATSRTDVGGAVLDGGFVAARTGSALTLDGALDEAAWQRATATVLRPTRTGAPLTQRTTVRFLVDDDALYVGFDVDDDDPHSAYTARDEPIYDSEALELFVDADGDRDDYVELQASWRDVRFDARFTGGARRGMDVAFDLPFLTATKMREGGYTQEWRVPRAQVPDATPTDTRWLVNVYRLERRRRGDVVVATEASALSPPERGDFHALDKLVWLDLARE